MRALVSFVLTAVTVVVQLTIVDRIAFPGGGGPDLVLLLVAALALAGGPMAGVLTGFCAGLALDVAPPGSHFTGQDALVFCLIGYACGLLSDDFSGDAEQGHTALFEILVTAAGAVCGEALVALLGVMLSDPRVTWPAITHVLPAALAYDVLLCPFVLYAAAATLRLAGVRREDHRPGFSASQVRASQSRASQGRSPLPSASPGAMRQREPQLKLGRPAARPAPAAYSPGGLSAGSARVRFGGRRGQGALGGSLLGGASLGAASLGGARLGSPRLSSSRLGGSRFGGAGAVRFGRSSMGRSLLGGSVFSRSASSLGNGQVFGRSAPLGRSSPLRHRGNPMRSAGRGLTGRAPRLSRGGMPRSPGRNWLRGTSSRGAFSRPKSPKSLTSKGLGHKGLGRKAFKPSRVPRLKARRRWGRRGGYL